MAKLCAQRTTICHWILRSDRSSKRSHTCGSCGHKCAHEETKHAKKNPGSLNGSEGATLHTKCCPYSWGLQQNRKRTSTLQTKLRKLPGGGNAALPSSPRALHRAPPPRFHPLLSLLLPPPFPLPSSPLTVAAGGTSTVGDIPPDPPPSTTSHTYSMAGTGVIQGTTGSNTASPEAAGAYKRDNKTLNGAHSSTQTYQDTVALTKPAICRPPGRQDTPTHTHATTSDMNKTQRGERASVSHRNGRSSSSHTMKGVDQKEFGHKRDASRREERHRRIHNKQRKPAEKATGRNT